MILFIVCCRSLLRLNSFLFDYQLRTIHGQIAGVGTPTPMTGLLRKGYHVAAFLDDFCRYHTMRPTYAHNLVGGGDTVRIPIHKEMSPQRLFEYMLSHDNSIKFRAVKMDPTKTATR